MIYTVAMKTALRILVQVIISTLIIYVAYANGDSAIELAASGTIVAYVSGSAGSILLWWKAFKHRSLSVRVSTAALTAFYITVFGIVAILYWVDPLPDTRNELNFSINWTIVGLSSLGYVLLSLHRYKGMAAIKQAVVIGYSYYAVILTIIAAGLLLSVEGSPDPLPLLVALQVPFIMQFIFAHTRLLDITTIKAWRNKSLPVFIASVMGPGIAVIFLTMWLIRIAVPLQ